MSYRSTLLVIVYYRRLLQITLLALVLTLLVQPGVLLLVYTDDIAGSYARFIAELCEASLRSLLDDL